MSEFQEVLKSYQLTLGLEVHAQVATKTKIWCQCPISIGQSFENAYVCEVCSGHPGTLPVLNQEVLYKAITLGLALEGEVVAKMSFDRKNYFYPDIPKGYQISQYKNPLVTGGELLGIKITRVHLEEDTARSLHEREDSSLVDFNRAPDALFGIIMQATDKKNKAIPPLILLVSKKNSINS